MPIHILLRYRLMGVDQKDQEYFVNCTLKAHRLSPAPSSLPHLRSHKCGLDLHRGAAKLSTFWLSPWALHSAPPKSEVI